MRDNPRQRFFLPQTGGRHIQDASPLHPIRLPIPQSWRRKRRRDESVESCTNKGLFGRNWLEGAIKRVRVDGIYVRLWWNSEREICNSKTFSSCSPAAWFPGPASSAAGSSGAMGGPTKGSCRLSWFGDQSIAEGACIYDFVAACSELNIVRKAFGVGAVGWCCRV